MERPNLKDYLTTNQMEYDEQIQKYYQQLNKYVDYLEEQIKNIGIPVIHQIKNENNNS